jgi:hypothetical protein
MPWYVICTAAEKKRHGKTHPALACRASSARRSRRLRCKAAATRSRRRPPRCSSRSRGLAGDTAAGAGSSGRVCGACRRAGQGAGQASGHVTCMTAHVFFGLFFVLCAKAYSLDGSWRFYFFAGHATVDAHPPAPQEARVSADTAAQRARSHHARWRRRGCGPRPRPRPRQHCRRTAALRCTAAFCRCHRRRRRPRRPVQAPGWPGPG